MDYDQCGIYRLERSYLKPLCFKFLRKGTRKVLEWDYYSIFSNFATDDRSSSNCSSANKSATKCPATSCFTTIFPSRTATYTNEPVDRTRYFVSKSYGNQFHPKNYTQRCSYHSLQNQFTIRQNCTSAFRID